MIIVTGGAGFIGSNLIHQLNRAGERNILLVDNFAPAPNLTGPKFLNLAGAEFCDYMDKREFRAALKNGEFRHQENSRHPASGGLLEHARRRWPLHDGQQLHLLKGAAALRARPLDSAGLCFDGCGLRGEHGFHRARRQRTSAERLWLLEAGLRQLCSPLDAGR